MHGLNHDDKRKREFDVPGYQFVLERFPPRVTISRNIAAELTVFTKRDGNLTKSIKLDPDGAMISDGSDCIMTRGTAQRTKIASVEQLADLIGHMKPDQALALGALRTGLPNKVEIVTKAKLLNSAPRPNTIARVAHDIIYPARQPAFALLDFDTKGMPPDIVAEVERLGGFLATLLSLFPALEGVARVTRTSTSTGLFRSDTGDKLHGSDGLHVYLAVQDGTDIERCLKNLHDRCWLAGCGWMIVGAGGQLLERSLIDRSVFGAERLVFEGPPILKSPLQQDRESRRPVAVDGEILDTIAAFPPLTTIDTSKLKELKAKEAHRLAGESSRARNTFINLQAERIVKRTGKTPRAAERIIRNHCNGVLLPPVELPFDDPELAGCTVADVLGDPDRFEGATMADPLEGISYGRGKAKIMRNPDGALWIHSFAHGRSIYRLKLDAEAVLAAMQQADANEVTKVLLDLATNAELDDEETEHLIDEAVKRSGRKKTTVKTMLKKRLDQYSASQAKQDQQRRAAQRTDPRPQVRRPDKDAEWLPVMKMLNEVLGGSADTKPPSRNIEGIVTRARKQVIPQTHAFTNTSANADVGARADADHTPVPEQWVLSSLNSMELGEMIEAHIDFVDPKGRSVQLPKPFIDHYLQRDDQALPIVAAIATTPMVSADGEMLAPEGLDRQRGIIFEIPKEVRAILPDRKDCTDQAIKEAARFLFEDWLCDVNADATGKAIIVAAALTLIERTLLPDRPAFPITAGRRGGGKTTVIKMIIMAVMAVEAAASSWSKSEEERRKVLLSLLLSGVGYVIWDNIERGSKLSCPHIERSCTTGVYSDRILGVSQTISASAAMIHFFTGNSIAPRGDLASRSLTIEIAVDRPDPENRDFKHPDPIGWTKVNRPKILQALYTILLGNPQLRQSPNAPAKTRFKMWWRLVGSAVEHATRLYDSSSRTLDFGELFIQQEEELDEDSTTAVDALEMLLETFPMGEFKASDVADLINDDLIASGPILRSFLYPFQKLEHKVSPKSAGKQLSDKLLNNPVYKDGEQLTLRVRLDNHKNKMYFIEQKSKSSKSSSS
jgi:hypothetical protein